MSAAMLETLGLRCLIEVLTGRGYRVVGPTLRGNAIVLAEALRIIDANESPLRPFVEVSPRAAVGHGVSEAPRGLLYHRNGIGDDGLIRSATIVAPTSQNQRRSKPTWPTSCRRTWTHQTKSSPRCARSSFAATTPVFPAQRILTLTVRRT